MVTRIVQGWKELDTNTTVDGGSIDITGGTLKTFGEAVTAYVVGAVNLVPANVETTVATLVANGINMMTTIHCSGDNYAKFRFYINGDLKDTIRTGPERNGRFYFVHPYTITKGDVVDIKVEHYFDGDNFDFEVTIYGFSSLGNDAVSPDEFEMSVTVNDSIAAITNLPSLLSASLDLYDVVVITSEDAAHLSIIASVHQPTIVIESSTVHPLVLGMNLTVNSPTLSISANVTVLPAVQSMTSTTYAPVITSTTDGVITPATLAVTSAIETPTIIVPVPLQKFLLEGNDMTDSTGNFTPVFQTGTSIDTVTYRTGTGSIYFDGSTTSWVEIPHDSILDYGSDDFTIEMWVKFGEINRQQALMGDVNGGVPFAFYTNENVLCSWKSTTGSTSLANGGALGMVNWYHLCLERYGDNLTYYQDGVAKQVANIAGKIHFEDQHNVYIGSIWWSPQNFKGWMEDVSWYSGEAKYKGPFTPA